MLPCSRSLLRSIPLIADAAELTSASRLLCAVLASVDHNPAASSPKNRKFKSAMAEDQTTLGLCRINNSAAWAIFGSTQDVRLASSKAVRFAGGYVEYSYARGLEGGYCKLSILLSLAPARHCLASERLAAFFPCPWEAHLLSSQTLTRSTEHRARTTATHRCLDSTEPYTDLTDRVDRTNRPKASARVAS